MDNPETLETIAIKHITTTNKTNKTHELKCKSKQNVEYTNFHETGNFRCERVFFTLSLILIKMWFTSVQINKQHCHNWPKGSKFILETCPQSPDTLKTCKDQTTQDGYYGNYDAMTKQTTKSRPLFTKVWKCGQTL